MQENILNVHIGGNISRTSSLVVAPTSSQNIADTEVAIVDSNGTALTSGATINTTEYIRFVEGLSDTYEFVNPAGTTISGIRKVLYSPRVYCADVFEYTTEAYSAPTQQVTTISFGTLTPIIGEEYIIKLVYTDMHDRPGQVTKTYDFTAETTNLADLYAGFVSVINADSHRRINAGGGSTNLTLTAKAYDDDDKVNCINDYAQVSFKVFLSSDNYASDASVTLTTAPDAGNGYWKLVRDEEKWSQGDRGFTNRTKFPVETPEFRTQKGESYNTITVVSKNRFADAGGDVVTSKITNKIFIADGSGTANQADTIIAALNTWIASGPTGKTAGTIV